MLDINFDFSNTVLELWSAYHFVFMAAFLFIVIMIGLILKNKDPHTQKIVLIVLAFANLALHFIKMFIPEYKDALPYSYVKLTFESICACSTILFPFILLSKNKYAKDYMFYMGIITGIASMVYPGDAIGRDISDLNLIRFYICHSLLFIVPLYMVVFGFHKLSWKRIPFFTLEFMLVLYIILANEVILMESGFVEMRNYDFLNPNYRNTSFIFGPTEELKELSDKYIDIFVPKIFKEVQVGTYEGSTKYTPVLWLLCPCLIYFTVIASLIYLIFVKVFKVGMSVEEEY